MANKEIIQIATEKTTLLANDMLEGQEAAGGTNSSFKVSVDNIVKYAQERPLTATLDANNQIITQAELQDYSETVSTPTIATGVLTLDLALSNVFNVSLTENVTSITLSNVTPSAGVAVTLIISQDATGGRSITWPTSVKWGNGVEHDLTIEANAVDIVSLETIDNGVSWFGLSLGSNFV